MLHFVNDGLDVEVLCRQRHVAALLLEFPFLIHCDPCSAETSASPYSPLSVL